MKKLNKKGAFGIDTVKAVLITLLIIGVIAVVSYLSLTTLRSTYESTEKLNTATTLNQTLTAVQYTPQALTNYQKRNCQATIINVANATSGAPISATNYSVVGGCYLRSVGNSAYNNTDWNVSFSITYNSPEANELVSNVTVGTSNFFKQIPTFFTLLSVVVLILIIAIVIIAVTRFRSGEGMEMGGGSEREGISEEL